MAIIRWEELRRWGEVDEQNYRVYYREFMLYSDDKQDGPLTVSAAIPLQLWVSHYSVPGESDVHAKLKSIRVEPVGGEQYLWKQTVRYDNKPFDANSIAEQSAGLGGPPSQPSAPSPPGGQSPAVRPWSIKFGARQTEQAISEDLTGAAVVASNGQPFEGGLMVPVAVPYFQLTCYAAAPNYHKVGLFVNHCNQGAFLGFNSGTLRCTDYQIQSQYEDAYGYYYQKDLTFEINNEGWDVSVLDAGTHTYSSSLGWTPIKDAFGNQVSAPVPLNGFGQPLAAGSAPVYKTFQVYRLRDFSNIL